MPNTTADDYTRFQYTPTHHSGLPTSDRSTWYTYVHIANLDTALTIIAKMGKQNANLVVGICLD
jgi:hypothetical protein